MREIYNQNEILITTRNVNNGWAAEILVKPHKGRRIRIDTIKVWSTSKKDVQEMALQYAKRAIDSGLSSNRSTPEKQPKLLNVRRSGKRLSA